MTSGPSRLFVDVLVAISITCAVVVGYWAVSGYVALSIEGPGTCWYSLSDEPGRDPASEPAVRGELQWNWLPPVLECAWALDDQGVPVGPPDGRRDVRTEPESDPAVAWFVVACAVVVLIALGAFLWQFRRTRREDRADAPVA